MTPSITNDHWRSYDQTGYLYLGKLLTDAELSLLRTRIDDIMLGQADLPYDRLLMQLDSETGKYEDAGQQTKGHKGATLAYRKIQNLEYDAAFRAYMQRPLFREICACIYGQSTPVAAFRAMFMNKPARKGTFLPWHQDRWATLDRDPLITIWTALDPATIANGCVQVVPGTHQSLINPAHHSGFVTPEQAQEFVAPERIVHLELAAGEAVLLHNWLLHSSDVNRTDIPRRAFSVCYMDARTIDANGDQFTVIFDDGVLATQPSAT